MFPFIHAKHMGTHYYLKFGLKNDVQEHIRISHWVLLLNVKICILRFNFNPLC